MHDPPPATRTLAQQVYGSLREIVTVTTACPSCRHEKHVLTVMNATSGRLNISMLQFSFGVNVTDSASTFQRVMQAAAGAGGSVYGCGSVVVDRVDVVRGPRVHYETARVFCVSTFALSCCLPGNE